MAERRMFCKTIIDSDLFLDMPLTAQALYFHLAMRADDDGFVNSPKKIQRSIGSNDDDMKLLLAKGFIIAFESGIIVITHWKMHNLIRKDRYKETSYKSEMSLLELDENETYFLPVTHLLQDCTKPDDKMSTVRQPYDDQMTTIRQPSDNQMTPQYSIDKYSIDKSSIDKSSIGQESAVKERVREEKERECEREERKPIDEVFDNEVFNNYLSFRRGEYGNPTPEERERIKTIEAFILWDSKQKEKS